MHVCNCLVALANDVANKHPLIEVTVAEMILIHHIHGDASISEIEYVGNKKIEHLALREKLNAKYPKYRNLITGIWQDNGGKFPTDVRKLDWPTHLFKTKHPEAHNAADEAEEAAVHAALNADEPTEDVGSV